MFGRKESSLNPPSILSKIFYAILLSPLSYKQPMAVSSKSILDPIKSKYKRTISIINWLDRAIPGVSAKLSRLMYKNNLYPWKPVSNQLIAAGSGAAVFIINWKNEEKVLRIYRKSIGKPFGGLLEIARHYKQNYEGMRIRYGASPDLVLPMDFLIISGLPLGIPVAASLQPYIGGQKQDIFEDFSDEEILDLLNTHENLRKQFLLFARQTLDQWKEQETCFDFLGRENLMLIKENETYRLHIADVGLFELDAVAKKYPEKIDRIEARVKKLAFLYDQAKQFSGQGTKAFSSVQHAKGASA